MSANLLNNKIGVEQAQNLATILKDHATLKSLCGNKGDETELDLSGKNIGSDGAILLEAVAAFAARHRIQDICMADRHDFVRKPAHTTGCALSFNVIKCA